MEMKWFKHLKVGAKLFMGFSLMILFLVVIGLAGFQSTKSIHANLEDIFSLRLPSLDYLIEADRDLQQLLVSERSMIFANTNSEVFKALVGDYEENLKQSDERWNKYKALAATSKEKSIIPKYEQAREEWKAISRKIVDGRVADTRQGRREALDLTLGIAKTKFEQMREYLNQLTDINLEDAEKAHHEAVNTYKSTLVILLGTIGAGLLAGIFLMWIINRGVTRPLREVIEGLTDVSDQVASGSGQVSASSQKLAEEASEQAASIEETSSSLEEMASTTKQNADNAGEAKAMMEEASGVVEKVNRHMGDMAEAIHEITRSSEETGKIIKTIDEIAFQTNLLALNAAVEAARAGEAGAGFAVVADEVRNLAMRAAEAAKNTSTLIEGTIRAVRNGNELTQSTQEAFKENMEISRRVDQLVAEIAAASSEQAQGIDQVNTAVAEMDKVVQEVAANAEESASASEEMNAQAVQMKAFVEDMINLVGRTGQGSSVIKRKARKKNMDERATVQRGLKTRPGREQACNKDKKSIVSGTTKSIPPDQVIPLDDGFKGF